MTPGSRSTWATLLRVVMWWDGLIISLGRVSSLVVVEAALGLPGGLLVVFSRGSEDLWVFGDSGFLMVFLMSES